MSDRFAPTLAAAHARIAAVQPDAYARTRNAIDGAVTGLSPYITHGLVSLTEVLAGVAARHPLPVQHKFVFELGWRAYFRHVWQHRGDGILTSLHPGLLPDDAYADHIPADIREACTGVPVVDEAVRTLYATGMLHNHARMWLASYMVHVCHVHWRVGADWLYAHLLDGDLASNHLSWQWVAGTGSHKPYLFNADNVARYAPAAWHSPGSVIDTSYEALDRLARQPVRPTTRPPATQPLIMGSDSAPIRQPVSRRGSELDAPNGDAVQVEPRLGAVPPDGIGCTAPDADAVKGRDVWLVHPWCLGPLPGTLPADTVVIGVFLADFHRIWPWSERRWRFVGSRMAELAAACWHGDAADVGAALAGARSVRSIAEPHLAPWLPQWADCMVPPPLFTPVTMRCDSFSQWWTRTSRGKQSALDLLAVNDLPARLK
jgi:deoxyribodipyrimidine photo-lyase